MTVTRSAPVLASTLVLAAASMLLQTPATAQGPGFEPTGKPWIDMDYGPFLSLTVQVSGKEPPAANTAYKGLAVRLDAPTGTSGDLARGREFAVFDTDTLRWVGAWHGEGFIDWKGIAFDGSHNTHARIRGDLVFENLAGPGWARPGTAEASPDFDDVRVLGKDGGRYGPLPEGWARYRRLHRDGDRVVVEYTVGSTRVREAVRGVGPAASRAVARDVEVGPRPTDLVLRVADEPGRTLRVDRIAGRAAVVASEPPAEPTAPRTTAAGGALELDGTSFYEVEGEGPVVDFEGAPFTVFARIRTRSDGTVIALAPAADRNWAPDGKSLFVRGGRLCYDVGWVGAARGTSRVDDGVWHDVAATYTPDDGVLSLWVDGRLEAEKKLAPRGRGEGRGDVLRIGYTSPNFPDPSPFEGEIAELAILDEALGADAVGALGGGGVEHPALVARWTTAAGDALPGRTADTPAARRRALGAARGGGGLAGTGIHVLVTADAGATPRFEIAEDGSIRLRVPAGEAPVRFSLVSLRQEASVAGAMAAGAPAAGAMVDAGAVAAALDDAGSPPDLSSLRPATPWDAVATTRATPVDPAAAARPGPFTATALPTPRDNPYRTWMRLGGFDFFGDGDRAAVCTWGGDVWIVDGLAGDEFTWRRFAAGLFQPLGLVVRDGQVFVLGRDQITRLDDVDGDGTADVYENFNNDAQVTEHFHEFAMDLQLGPDGRFYYTKGGRHAKDSVVPQHGTLLEVSADGTRTREVAYGFRAPNGLAVLPDERFVVSDQEGHWMPANRINLVRPGGFYGYMWSYLEGRERPTRYDEPLAWVDHDLDRSPAQQLVLRGEDWGPLDGELLSLSYGTGSVLLVLRDEVDGLAQGAVTRLPIPAFPTGIMRARLHPRDGSLYVCGLFGWAGNRTAPGGLFRVRPTGAPPFVPTAAHATERGIALRFSRPLDARRAARAGRYSLTRWNYKWQARYGSDDWRVTDGERGREPIEVTAAEVSADGHWVFLDVDDMRPCDQIRLEMRLASADGQRWAEPIHMTVHRLAPRDAHRDAF